MPDNRVVFGYDESAIRVGDRVELHPGTDLWMAGARYGKVVRMSLTHGDKVHVKLDKLSGIFAGPPERFRKLKEEQTA